MQTRFRIINQTGDVFGLLARVSHGDVGIAGFTMRAQQGNAAIQNSAAVGQRGIMFYDDFSHAHVGNTVVTLTAGVPTSIIVSGNAGALSFAIDNTPF